MLKEKTQEEILETMFADECHRCMNNLYLEIERGDVKMSLHFRLSLEQLLVMAYPEHDEPMRDWWFEEFQKLPNWLDF